MILRSDGDSVAELARLSSTEQLTNTLGVLNNVKHHNLSDGEGLDANIEILIQAIKLKSEAAIYAFHKYDGLGEVMGQQSAEESYGISLFKRYGNKLQHLLGAEAPCGIEQVIEYLKQNGIHTILTGSIVGSFCGVSHVFDSDTYNDEMYEIKYDELHHDEYEAFLAAGIEVVVLNELV